MIGAIPCIVGSHPVVGDLRQTRWRSTKTPCCLRSTNLTSRSSAVRIPEIASLRGHSGWVNSAAFSPDGKTLASASLDGTVKLWNDARIASLEWFHQTDRTERSKMASLGRSRIALRFEFSPQIPAHST
jgi:WD40 repeat protein